MVICVKDIYNLRCLCTKDLFSLAQLCVKDITIMWQLCAKNVVNIGEFRYLALQLLLFPKCRHSYGYYCFKDLATIEDTLLQE